MYVYAYTLVLFFAARQSWWTVVGGRDTTLKYAARAQRLGLGGGGGGGGRQQHLLVKTYCGDIIVRGLINLLAFSYPRHQSKIKSSQHWDHRWFFSKSHRKATDQRNFNICV